MRNTGSTPLALPREILEMLYVDAKGEVDVSVVNRTLTARPVTDSQPGEEASRESRKKRIAGLNRGMISMSEDFDTPLPDEFWLGRE
jgi:antitoxin component of MazEF toxin-antitoxin module